jgi:SAM-dependent methyltransferase
MFSTIEKCIVCNNTVEEVVSLGEQYVVDFPKERDDSLLKAPLTLMRCTKCSMIQLKHRVHPDRLYKKMWYRSGINQMMKDELLKIVERASSTVELKDDDKVLDIGCNDGTLLGWYPKGVMTFGIDPCKELVEEGIKTTKIDIGIPDYFSEAAINSLTRGLGVKPPKFKIITAISCFYDVLDPVRFLKDCKALLDNEGVLVIQMNYLLKMLDDTAFDNVSHEHLGYYSVMALKEAVTLAGLELQGVEESSCNGGSIRVYITKKEFTSWGVKDTANKLWLITKLDRMLLEEMRAGLDTNIPYTKFIHNMRIKISSIKNLIGNLDRKEKIYVYGASTRGTVLMQILCREGGADNFIAVAERDKNKFGLHMVGTWLPIVPEESFRKNATYALILPWHFKDGIIKREEEWIKKGGKFIMPLPKPELIHQDENVMFQVTGKLLCEQI